MKRIARLSVVGLVSLLTLAPLGVARVAGQETVDAKLLVGEWVGQWRRTQGAAPQQAQTGQYSLTITALEGDKVSGAWSSGSKLGETEGRVRWS